MRANAFARLKPCSGNVAISFAVALPALLAIGGAAIDYAHVLLRRNALQVAADTAVLSGANTLKMATPDPQLVLVLTEQMVRDNAGTPAKHALTIKPSVSADRRQLAVSVSETVQLLFGPFLGRSTMEVSVQATASVVGRMRLCMLALDQMLMGAISLEHDSLVTAKDCSLYSNSTHAKGLLGKSRATAYAQVICSAGGYSGERANFNPTPVTDCPVIPDPLANRAPPPVGDCVRFPDPPGSGDGRPNIVRKSRELEPGTYCGGLWITDKAVVTLKPGVYVMKDGPLIVDAHATLSGTGVGFYFTGNRGGLLFDRHTAISLAAPTNGPMAGLLLFEERQVADPVPPPTNPLVTPPPPPPPGGIQKPLRLYRIISDNARTLLGTIYLPRGRLVIDASRPVADQSAYTVIVADQINLYDGPNLYLNADYDRSNVPVPEGVGPISGRVLMTR
ncbi:hypothetical protein LKMONMHP_0368 [Methylobacterium organophilum]|uniref:Putative Flp pilus-assembly TadG-like N-terminal domain-containing protein n=1 Tax=Methylobacterium organophilum TaxID=410 RepID=A0ABQ4T1K9_METOR|nr:hypothetical protein LKMONMHP_0368 [Methylobacterium organophilum]